MQQLLEKLDEFKARWPQDYMDRCGYLSILERIAEQARIPESKHQT